MSKAKTLAPIENPENAPLGQLNSRLPMPLIEEVKALAKAESVTLNRAVQWLLTEGISNYRRASE